MDARNAEKVQGHFSSTSGPYNSSRACLETIFKELLSGGVCMAAVGSPQSAASLLLPPPAPFSFEARPCLSMSLVAPGIHIAVLSHFLPFKAESHAPPLFSER